jgi:Ca2+:H+ antiporter
VSSKILLGSFALVPLAVASRLLGVDAVLQFGLAVLALAPLAWLISEATDQAAQHTGPAIGGLLNATFANVPELMIALFALSDGLFDVVRGSLTGSVVGNLLLVLGVALAVGGEGELDRESARRSLAVLALAIPLLGVAAVPNFVGGDPERAYALASFPTALVLLAAYGYVLVRSLEEKRGEEGERGERRWTLRKSLFLLGLGTVATAAVSETATGSIGSFADALHLSEFFVAAVIVAVAGNAAEHGAAIVVAARGELKLAADIGLESSAQVAALLIPAVALLSWLIEPFPLAFSAVELIVLAGAVVVAAVLLHRARSTRARGLALAGAYVAAAGAFALQ